MNAERADAGYRAKLYLVDGVRTFGLGFFTIIFVIAARSAGMGALAIGILTTISVLVGIFTTRLVDWVVPRWGSRIPFASAGLLMAATGAVLLIFPGRLGISMAAVFGFLPPLGGQFVAVVVEGSLAHTPAARRTKVFATYGLIVTLAGASGSLFAALPGFLGFDTSQSVSVLTTCLVIFGAVVLLVSFLLPVDHLLGDSADREEEAGDPSASRKALVYRLALLFVADAAGSGIVTSTLVLYWLHVHFRLALPQLSLLYFGMDILSAVSYPLAERIARKIGLLHTAVFTHIPSSLLLIAVPFVPNGAVAAAFLLARALLVEMDVPTQKSYIASIVPPSLRAFAVNRTSMGSQTGAAIGPIIGGAALSSLGNVAPFFLGGVVKISYDITLWRSFRRVKSAEKPS
ncbi:MFS transporter [Ferrimicrobium acidiphilum]|uniref:Multidrug resistance protein MdtG n=1 Tax=Ferrimicrobium acidiphilum DSM 19497 TaxID=1121877 RepID=A0A0D8FT92_9ACTN|nr:MFS transporter [Ferrimicrobium acidiphilum]KJE75467.1 multidrug resistance protein MdtG [Ferrimicrobium acidiphilum DSM 19497]MCL5053739.1 MFS transporter [Gammaproteobacteria bacterium]